MDALASGRPPQRDRLSLGPGRQYGDQCPMGMREGLFAGLISIGRESHACHFNLTTSPSLSGVDRQEATDHKTITFFTLSIFKAHPAFYGSTLETAFGNIEAPTAD